MLYNTLIAFLAGIITFISPCVLPLIPAYIFYITGLKADEKIEEKSKYIIKILLFIAGFTVIFVSLGLITGILAYSIKNIRFYLNIIFGVLIIIFSLHFMGLFNILLLNSEKRMNFANIKAGYFTPMVIGMAFAAGWTPCVGPVLGSILGLVASEQSITKGAFLLFIYSAGMGIPLLLTALFFNYVKPVVNYLKIHSEKIKIVSGIFLFFIGILILSGTLSNITIIVSKFAYFLEDSLPVSSYIFSVLLFIIGFLFTLRMILKKKILIVPAIFSAIFIITGILNMLNILPLLKYIINYLLYQGI